jgi:hypothetical protein
MTHPGLIVLLLPASPIHAEAQEPVPTIGFLTSQSLKPKVLTRFRQGLGEFDYVEEPNLHLSFSASGPGSSNSPPAVRCRPSTLWRRPSSQFPTVLSPREGLAPLRIRPAYRLLSCQDSAMLGPRSPTPGLRQIPAWHVGQFTHLLPEDVPYVCKSERVGV